MLYILFLELDLDAQVESVDESILLTNNMDNINEVIKGLRNPINLGISTPKALNHRSNLDYLLNTTVQIYLK